MVQIKAEVQKMKPKAASQKISSFTKQKEVKDIVIPVPLMEKGQYLVVTMPAEAVQEMLDDAAKLPEKERVDFINSWIKDNIHMAIDEYVEKGKKKFTVSPPASKIKATPTPKQLPYTYEEKGQKYLVLKPKKAEFKPIKTSETAAKFATPKTKPPAAKPLAPKTKPAETSDIDELLKKVAAGKEAKPKESSLGYMGSGSEAKPVELGAKKKPTETKGAKVSGTKVSGPKETKIGSKKKSTYEEKTGPVKKQKVITIGVNSKGIEENEDAKFKNLGVTINLSNKGVPGLEETIKIRFNITEEELAASGNKLKTVVEDLTKKVMGQLKGAGFQSTYVVNANYTFYLEREINSQIKAKVTSKK